MTTTSAPTPCATPGCDTPIWETLPGQWEHVRATADATTWRNLGPKCRVLGETPSWAQPAAAVGCGRCRACLSHEPSVVIPGGNAAMDIMVVCTKCANKRCPKAEAHWYRCTGSNEPDQTPELEAGAGRHCPDCGIAPGQRHEEGCDVARCSVCGFQRLSCAHAEGEGDGGIWSGEWPGLAECREFGLYAVFNPVGGWLTGCSPRDEGAVEDTNTLMRMAARGALVWNGERWVARGSAAAVPDSEVALCDACFTDCEQRGVFSSDIALMEGPHGWFLLQTPGERDNVLANLGTAAPSPNPWPDFGHGDEAEEEAYCQGEEGRARLAALSAWADLAAASVTWTESAHPVTHWRLINALVAAGYDPQVDDDPALWVYDRAGRLLGTTE